MYSQTPQQPQRTGQLESMFDSLKGSGIAGSLAGGFLGDRLVRKTLPNMLGKTATANVGNLGTTAARYLGPGAASNLIPMFNKMTSWAGKTAGKVLPWFSTHPIAGMALAMGASTLGSMLGAGLEQSISKPQGGYNVLR